MSLLLRYQVQPGQSWREHHKLIQVEQSPNADPSGLENEWTLTQRVLETREGKCLINWVRQDLAPVAGSPNAVPQSGEIWIDSLGRTSTDLIQWSPPLFPEHPLDVGEVWTQEVTAAGLPIHYTLEKLEDKAVQLVSYTQSQEPEMTREIRGAVRVCRETGRLQSSTTVTRISFADGRVLQSVIEVQTKEL